MANLTQDVTHGIHHAKKFGLDDTSVFVEILTKALVRIGLTRCLEPKAKSLVMPSMQCALSIVKREKRPKMIDQIRDLCIVC